MKNRWLKMARQLKEITVPSNFKEFSHADRQRLHRRDEHATWP